MSAKQAVRLGKSDLAKWLLTYRKFGDKQKTSFLQVKKVFVYILTYILFIKKN